MNEVVMYAYFERVLIQPNGKPYKQPKYTMQEVWGKYTPMQHLIGRDGKISLVLQDSKTSGSKDSTSTPPMKLQAKNSINLTGLHNYYTGCDVCEYAYGNPYKPKDETKFNPFKDNLKDGFLFRFLYEDGDNVPKGFEMMVIPNVESLIRNRCEMLIMGGYNRTLENARKQATDNPLSLI